MRKILARTDNSCGKTNTVRTKNRKVRDRIGKLRTKTGKASSNMNMYGSRISGATIAKVRRVTLSEENICKEINRLSYSEMLDISGYLSYMRCGIRIERKKESHAIGIILDALERQDENCIERVAQCVNRAIVVRNEEEYPPTERKNKINRKMIGR